MTRAEQIKGFDPSGVGELNGHFIGLPFTAETAQVILLPVPWDVTTSYSAGTAGGPANILAESVQLDLFDRDLPDVWTLGLFMTPVNQQWKLKSEELRPKSERYITFIENGGTVDENSEMRAILDEINQESEALEHWVYEQTQQLLQLGKRVGVIGGEHSVPLGYLKALAEKEGEFGILQLDAHMDLREAYEGFQQSHASIFFNAMKIPQITKLVQVGIRDCAASEVSFAEAQGKRVQVFYDQEIREQQYLGSSFTALVGQIVAALPRKVYISFDIDGLEPAYCPNTGTPVMGGLHPNEARFLLKQIVQSGRQIIGFDLCEVAGQPHAFDGNVGARIAYMLSNWMGKSQGMI